MKLNMFNDKENELYLVRMQSRVPKWINCFKKGKRMPSTAGLRRAISLRIMAPSRTDAINKALNRKRTRATTPAFRVLSCRKFYA